MLIPEDIDAPGPARVDAGKLWAGGLAMAVVAGLAVIAGVFVARGVFGIPVIAPKGASVFGDLATVAYADRAAACALLATAVLHALLLGAPRPFAFFVWMTALAGVAAAAAPLAQSGPSGAKIFTALINIVVGVAIISLLPGVARSAIKPGLAQDGRGRDQAGGQG